MFSIALFFFFFFNDTATTEIYTLSLHDALLIFQLRPGRRACGVRQRKGEEDGDREDRKSTRLNSSHMSISYAVFCLKKKKNKTDIHNKRCVTCGVEDVCADYLM